MDIFSFHDTNNEFHSSYSNIDINIEVHEWHCKGSKLNTNKFNIYENNLCFNNIDQDGNFFYNVSIECDYYTEDQFLQIFKNASGPFNSSFQLQKSF